MSNLAANPSGSGGIYGQPGQTSNDEILGIVNKLKNREWEDYKNKANFNADLSMKQERIRRLFDIEQQQRDQTGPQGGPKNVVWGDDSHKALSAMSGYQGAQLGIRQQELDLDSQKMVQQGRLGQEALDIKSDQQQLNQQKSDQLKDREQAKLQHKIEESDAKLELVKQGLEDRNKTAEDRLALQKELAANMKERYELDRAMKEHQFNTTNENHLATIKQQEEKLKQGAESETTTELNADGTKKVVSTKKGSAIKKRIAVIGPNGESGTVEEDDVLPSGWKRK